MEIGTAFHEGGASAALLADVEQLMRGWVAVHIGEKDRAFAEWLAARDAAAAGPARAKA